MWAESSQLPSIFWLESACCLVSVGWSLSVVVSPSPAQSSCVFQVSTLYFEPLDYDAIRMRATLLQRVPRVSYCIARYVKTQTCSDESTATACVSEKFLQKKDSLGLKSLIEQQTETLPPDVLKLLCNTPGKAKSNSQQELLSTLINLF